MANAIQMAGYDGTTSLVELMVNRPQFVGSLEMTSNMLHDVSIQVSVHCYMHVKCV